MDPQEPSALQDVERSGLGFVPLDATGRSFIAIVESALDGDTSVPPVPAPAPWPAPAPVGAEASRENRDTNRMAEQLTSREHDVLALLAEGVSNRRIAEILQVTLNTVSAHVKNIYAKLQVHSRVEALRFVLRTDGHLRPPA